MHYFVDESGLPDIFGRNGKIVIRQPDVGRFFILGGLAVQQVDTLAKEMDALRNEVVNDPYFRTVPSVRNKTAFGFHAKDDIPEIREKVFKLIVKHGIRFFAVIRDKSAVLERLHTAQTAGSPPRYQPNSLYDEMVTALFTGPYLLNTNNTITFSKRGAKDRGSALGEAIKHAVIETKRQIGEWKAQVEGGEQLLEMIDATPNYAARTIRELYDLEFTHKFVNDPWLKKIIQRGATDTVTHIQAVSSSQSAGLQAADYCLWSLYRLLTRREERYLDYIWDKVAIIRDMDDMRRSPRGEFYGNGRNEKESKRLTIAELQKRIRRDIGAALRLAHAA